MNSKKIIIATFSLLLCALLVMGTINVVIDPLFQYHKPWFGLVPDVYSARYQSAGIAKTFDYENVVLGNSMCANFEISDIERVFDGKTIKITEKGSYVLDWTYSLEILSNKENQPKNILLNLDPYFFDISSEVTVHEVPLFLYDYNYFNDVEYIFNFTLMRNYTYRMIMNNINDTLPDYNKVFVWGGKNDSGKAIVAENYIKGNEKERNQTEGQLTYTQQNYELLKEYFSSMPNTEFVFFCSPFSILYWRDKAELGLLDRYKTQFEKTFDLLSEHENVTLYFWADKEMLNIISDLNNYKDSTHYGMHINKEILKRIEKNIGELPKTQSEWQPLLDEYFDFLENFDYESIFI